MRDPNPPTIRQLQYFDAVARHLNYRSAAEELAISQPALTAQISALENGLKVALLERSRSGTHLTPEGRELLPHAREVIAAMRTLREHAAVASEGHQATYRLGVPPTLGPYLLPHVMPELHQRHSGLKLYVREQPHQILLQELRSGALDLAILPLPLDARGLVVQAMFTEPLRYVIPADHPLAGRSVVRPRQLRGEKVLTLEAQHHIHSLVKEACANLGAVIQRDYEGTSLDTLRQMVVMGLGTAFLPALYIHSEMHRPEALHVCDLQGMTLTREHGLAWRAGAPSRHFYRRLSSDIIDIVGLRLGKAISLAGKYKSRGARR
ncbi:hydrogen peroxide-inducible genes activator [Parahaliea mediterranea]|uniref:LysR family transcriptional regulator n=1 Tax=Parahaliea mediterranea TaxID=651086 RepID=A0A939DIY4_9GAMM|nr:hydrogen peroxide-inducible genes activator [Parahaliea mediterranea]MBN7798954.1 LysR family transcriptional regulator [Parahaliea mediterranea]